MHSITKNSFIDIGKIINTHGIFGELKLQVWFEDFEKVRNIKHFYLNNSKLNIFSCKTQKNNLIFKLKEITTVQEAVLYKGLIATIERIEIINENSFLSSDLLGFCVETSKGEILGKVFEIIKTGANDVLVINTGEDKLTKENTSKLLKTNKKKLKEILIPFIKQVCKKIDIEEKTITVDLLEGLM